MKASAQKLVNEFRLRISFMVGRKGGRKEGKRENVSGKKLWRVFIYYRSINKVERITRILRKSLVRSKTSLKGHIALKIIGSRNAKYGFHENKLLRFLI